MAWPCWRYLRLCQADETSAYLYEYEYPKKAVEWLAA